MAGPVAERAAASPLARGAVSLAAMAVLAALAAWTARRVPGGFFAPDDLIVLQRASGLLPPFPFPWRWIPGTLYPALGLSAFGLEPAGWLATNLALHAANVMLLFAWVRAQGAGVPAACLGTGLFAVSPLAFYPLQQVAGAGELMALGLALGAVLALDRPGRARVVLGTALFALALLCKESVALLPLVLLLPGRAGDPAAARLRRVLPALALAVLLAVVLLAGGAARGALGGGAYAARPGAHVVTNLLLYAGWIADFASVSPGAMNSVTAAGAAAGALVLAALAAAAALSWRSRGPGARGAAWFVLAIAPVLPLVGQVQAHYTYAPLAGAALALAALADAAFGRRVAPRVAWGVAVAGVLLLAARTDALAARRHSERLGETDLPADPWLRKSEAARNLVGDVGRGLDGRTARVVLMLPPEMVRSYSARGTAELSAGEVARLPGYLLARAVTDDGRALRLFHPNVTSVAWTDGWRDTLADAEWFLVEGGSHATPLGRGLWGQAHFAALANRAGLHAMVKRHLEEVFHGGEGDARTRFEYARALAGLGDAAGARRELERVMTLHPDPKIEKFARDGLARLATVSR